VTILVPMRAEVYAAYLQGAVAAYAQDNVASGRWPEQGALQRSLADFESLLPQGLATPANFLFELMAQEGGPSVGILWFAIEERHGIRGGYVYDVEVKPEFRRQGHARRAFQALEAIAVEMGLSSIGLHVFAHNPGAQRLYSELGFAVTGTNMLKPLGGAHRKDMKHTALLVIDLQRGAFDGVRCPPIAQPDTLIGNALTLVNAARAGGAPIVFVQHCDAEGDVFEEGSRHWELHDALVPQADDKVLKKHASSAFDGTDLAQSCHALGATDLVLCGLQSEFCVFNTAKSALAQGFKVVLAQDAHGTWPSKTESAAAISAGINRQLQEAGATLASTADLVGVLSETRA